MAQQLSLSSFTRVSSSTSPRCRHSALSEICSSASGRLRSSFSNLHVASTWSSATSFPHNLVSSPDWEGYLKLGHQSSFRSDFISSFKEVVNKNAANLTPHSCRVRRCCNSVWLRRDLCHVPISSTLSVKASHSAQPMAENAAAASRQPVLLLDVMGTLVRDPFYHDIPKFFGLTMSELLKQKHPTAWVEFETGQLSESDLVAKFFSDGRDFDYDGLKQCVKEGYSYLEGVEGLLARLRDRGYALHAFTNYPCWYQMIEEKLQLSQYVPWTFVSCHIGKRKPDSEIYIEAANHLRVRPADCIFVDDREVNVEAASRVGMRGLLFKNAKQLEQDLRNCGVDI